MIVAEGIIGLIMAVSKTDTAGIEEEEFAVAPNLLGVRVSAAQNTIGVRAEKFLKLLLRRGWQDDIIK